MDFHGFWGLTAIVSGAVLWTEGPEAKAPFVFSALFVGLKRLLKKEPS